VGVEDKYYADDEDAFLMKKFFKETPESKNLAQKKEKDVKEDKKEAVEEDGNENIEEGKPEPQNTQAAAAKKKKKRR